MIIDFNRIEHNFTINEKLTYKFYRSNGEIVDFNEKNIKIFSNLVVIPIENLVEYNIRHIEISSESISTKKIDVTDYVVSE